MSDLMNYLLENVNVTEEIEEVKLGGRFKDFKFKIKPVSGKDFNKFKEECRTIKKKKVTFDDAKFNELVITKCCIEPNFNDIQAIEKAGVKTPGEFINKVLKAGEIVDLSNAITELSGFDQDTDDIVEEAKN